MAEVGHTPERWLPGGGRNEVWFPQLLQKTRGPASHQEACVGGFSPGRKGCRCQAAKRIISVYSEHDRPHLGLLPLSCSQHSHQTFIFLKKAICIFGLLFPHSHGNRESPGAPARLPSSLPASSRSHSRPPHTVMLPHQDSTRPPESSRTLLLPGKSRLTPCIAPAFRSRHLVFIFSPVCHSRNPPLWLSRSPNTP